MIQLILKTTIAIKKWLFENYLKKIEKRVFGKKEAIIHGNEMAHYGDIITDSVFIEQEYMTDTSILLFTFWY